MQWLGRLLSRTMEMHNGFGPIWFMTGTCHASSPACHSFWGMCLVHYCNYCTPHFFSTLFYMSYTHFLAKLCQKFGFVCSPHFLLLSQFADIRYENFEHEPNRPTLQETWVYMGHPEIYWSNRMNMIQDELCRSTKEGMLVRKKKACGWVDSTGNTRGANHSFVFAWVACFSCDSILKSYYHTCMQNPTAKRVWQLSE